MVTEASFAPYEYYSDGKIVGIDVEIANEIAKELGKKLVIKDVAFDSIIHEVKSGKADIGVAGISFSEERAKQVAFSIDYVSSRQIVIVNKNGSSIDDINDLDDKKIAVQLGSVADIYVSEMYSKKQIVRQKKYLAAIQDLLDNKVDCVVMDELPALQIISNNNDLKILDDALVVDNYGIIVNKDNEELLMVVNNVIERLKNEGKISEYILKHSMN
jgi:polar amino acid transport system substrate-binding protein